MFRRTLTSLVILLFVLFAPCSYAARYSYFNCGDKEVLTSDCRACKENRDIEVEFLLNREQNSVMKKMYAKDQNGKKVTFSRVVKDCKIFDDKNWECNNEESTRINRIIRDQSSIFEMVDGVHRLMLRTCWTGSGHSCTVDSSYCAIKKSFFGF